MDYLITNVTVAGIFSKPNFQSEMISQSLLWEKLKIIESNASWYKVKQFDNYEGWIHEFYTIEFNNYFDNSAVYVETNPITQILSEPSLDSLPILNCSFGTILPAILTKKINYKWWHNIILPNKRSGWIQDSGYKKNSSLRGTIQKISKNLLGTPYVWGGRSSYGFDCSGFVQTIFKFCDIILPRDSCQQIKVKEIFVIDVNKSKIGDIIFFSNNNIINHVGIMASNNEFFHCSGDVRKDSLDSNAENYNKQLYKKFHSVMSIDGLL